ncbi:hypothetical protein RUM44_009657 [Polyplax serrata]|uniref:Uncharacterized protein n=1 Tax=Polyplax serrata TaxID=468196 RepID=A0ABR1ATB0_POLSC
MIRSIFSPPKKMDVLLSNSKMNVKHGEDLCEASMRGLIDGLIIGFVIGGAIGILQGWLRDAKSKDFCLLSSSWALNGAAVGAVVITLGNVIVQADMTPGFYVVR